MVAYSVIVVARQSSGSILCQSSDKLMQWYCIVSV